MNREKQIEEMSKDIFNSGVAIDGIDRAFAAVHGADMNDSHFMRIAQYLYNAGYRKQSEGEWIRREKIPGKITPEAVCSKCGREVVYQVIDNKWEFENYCPHCGTKMKGGAE